MASPNCGPRGLAKLITWLHMETMSSHQTCDSMESQTVRRIHLRIPLILHIVNGDLIGLLNELGEDRKEFFRLSILFFLFFALITVIRTRSCSMDWELLGPWQGVQIAVPTKFIAGDKDVGFVSFGTKDCINGEIFKEFVPNVEVVVIDGHHFISRRKLNEMSSFFSKKSFL
ncbi:hypothetical protein NC653_011668 [Populus alba x Populus x berolinensis]|uniref:Uncharacterized protein n=1 Tax=Populus alba x Populus x berolinensis TaxID=444605 RepID=A0AAD6R375_9ROSI|nr:hypothetical protein NC653_011668 [Populus alba x Populus x berolinensis]